MIVYKKYGWLLQGILSFQSFFETRKRKKKFLGLGDQIVKKQNFFKNAKKRIFAILKG